MKKVYAKVRGTTLGVGVEIKGERGVLLSSKTDSEEIKKEYEANNPDVEVIWED